MENACNLLCPRKIRGRGIWLVKWTMHATYFVREKFMAEEVSIIFLGQGFYALEISIELDWKLYANKSNFLSLLSMPVGEKILVVFSNGKNGRHMLATKI